MNEERSTGRRKTCCVPKEDSLKARSLLTICRSCSPRARMEVMQIVTEALGRNVELAAHDLDPTLRQGLEKLVGGKLDE